jgi:hypothetical protein
MKIPVYAFPEDDVRLDLIPAEAVSPPGELVHERAVAWTCPDPLHDGLPVKDLIACYDERVDVEVDGQLQERPATQWSR